MIYFKSNQLCEAPAHDMNGKIHLLLLGLLGIALATSVVPIWAKYKNIPWSVKARENYSASLTSEGVTIAVEPLFTDELAARVFDKSDMVTRGIMPLAVLIFNDNGFPVEVDGLSIELIHGSEHIQSLSPNEVVYRLFRKDKSWLSKTRIPRLARSELNEDALDDFDSKFLMEKIVAPHDKGGGFLYLHIDSKDLVSYLSKSSLYIPYVYRRDNGSRMIYFEIELEASIPPGMRR
jgi:hypothetical protein